MASRKVAMDCVGDDEDERPAKRPRLGVAVDVAAAPTPSLDNLNADCLLHVLSYLPSDDLNSIAICGRRYRTARAHESLDQTRSGTIVISEGCTPTTFLNAITANGWNDVFQGNLTCLKIAGMENVLDDPSSLPDLEERIANSQLTGVTRLELAGRFNFYFYYFELAPLYFCKLFPNLLQVDMSSMTVNPFLCLGFCESSPNLNRFACNGCEEIPLFPDEFGFASNLTELVLDDCNFDAAVRDTEMNQISDPTDNDMYLFYRCLEKLSIKNATITCRAVGMEDEPMSQEILIKIVRLHPTLRWLRSDLTEENVAMLKQERPGVAFVAD